MTRETVEHNVSRQRLIFERLLDFSGSTGPSCTTTSTGWDSCRLSKCCATSASTFR